MVMMTEMTMTMLMSKIMKVYRLELSFAVDVTMMVVVLAMLGVMLIVLRTLVVMVVVIASMIGVKGLGLPVLRAISNQYLALGLLNGLAIVTLAIIFDRVSQQYGRRLQAHREGADHG